ncbi:cell wall-active antibiotics response protein LiaF [Cohnella suwonensis]|uniref:Cell wall-active antibiotics response protein LiaF n=1 Tax=Cohnella suwonensis TaxID=696072 RepID=A0ABW0LSK8_9BACL
MQSSSAQRLLWGIVVVAIGVVFLLNQLGVTSISIGQLFSDFWPVLLIIFGLQGILMQQSGWWNGIVIVAGFYFLGRNMMWFDEDFNVFRTFGPIVIIIAGLCMIFRRDRGWRRRERDKIRDKWNSFVPPSSAPSGPPPAPPEWNELDREELKPKVSLEKESDRKPNPAGHREYGDYDIGGEAWNDRRDRREDPHWKRHHYSRFIGDAHFGTDYWELRPMNISHFIGDTTLDLTKAQIPVGETKINISSFIGDVKVYVPNDIGVGILVESNCLIGDVKVLGQKREGLFNQVTISTPGYSDSDKRVVLIVSSLIGDVRVTKVG